MRILQLNTSVNSGSTGRISEEIGLVAQKSGHEVYAAYGRSNNNSKLRTIRIGSDLDIYIHVINSKLFDNHAFASKKATLNFISELEIIKPDLIHLHNVHGYYLNVELLFNYIKKNNFPIVWTFHDCWPMTGHCSYFDWVNCDKWKTHCQSCPNTHGYPASLFFDASFCNYDKKRSLFSDLANVCIVTPSDWMAKIVKSSFLSDYRVLTINNGIDLAAFKPVDTEEVDNKYQLKGKKVILGVASIWDRRKGLADFVKISKELSHEYKIVLVGVSAKQTKQLPKEIKCISRTENVNELAALYSRADVFVNPTYVDNFPTTNLEALACGTPVITYNTGGSPEAVDDKTGFVVPKGDLNALAIAIITCCSFEKNKYSKLCRERAEILYNKTDRYNEYLDVYSNLLSKN